MTDSTHPSDDDATPAPQKPEPDKREQVPQAQPEADSGERGNDSEAEGARTEAKGRADQLGRKAGPALFRINMWAALAVVLVAVAVGLLEWRATWEAGIGWVAAGVAAAIIGLLWRPAWPRYKDARDAAKAEAKKADTPYRGENPGWRTAVVIGVWLVAGSFLTVAVLARAVGWRFGTSNFWEATGFWAENQSTALLAALVAAVVGAVGATAGTFFVARKTAYEVQRAATDHAEQQQQKDQEFQTWLSQRDVRSRGFERGAEQLLRLHGEIQEDLFWLMLRPGLSELDLDEWGRLNAASGRMADVIANLRRVRAIMPDAGGGDPRHPTTWRAMATRQMLDLSAQRDAVISFIGEVTPLRDEIIKSGPLSSWHAVVAALDKGRKYAANWVAPLQEMSAKAYARVDPSPDADSEWRIDRSTWMRMESGDAPPKLSAEDRESLARMMVESAATAERHADEVSAAVKSFQVSELERRPFAMKVEDRRQAALAATDMTLAYLPPGGMSRDCLAIKHTLRTASEWVSQLLDLSEVTVDLDSLAEDARSASRQSEAEDCASACRALAETFRTWEPVAGTAAKALDSAAEEWSMYAVARVGANRAQADPTKAREATEDAVEAAAVQPAQAIVTVLRNWARALRKKSAELGRTPDRLKEQIRGRMLWYGYGVQSLLDNGSFATDPDVPLVDQTDPDFKESQTRREQVQAFTTVADLLTAALSEPPEPDQVEAMDTQAAARFAQTLLNAKYLIDGLERQFPGSGLRKTTTELSKRLAAAAETLRLSPADRDVQAIRDATAVYRWPEILTPRATEYQAVIHPDVGGRANLDPEMIAGSLGDAATLLTPLPAWTDGSD